MNETIGFENLPKAATSFCINFAMPKKDILFMIPVTEFEKLAEMFELFFRSQGIDYVRQDYGR